VEPARKRHLEEILDKRSVRARPLNSINCT